MESELLDCGMESRLTVVGISSGTFLCGLESGLLSSGMVSRLLSSGMVSEQTGVGMVSQPESKSVSPAERDGDSCKSDEFCETVFCKGRLGEDVGCESGGFCEEGCCEFCERGEFCEGVGCEGGKVCRGGSSGVGEGVLCEGRGGEGGKGEFCGCEVSLVTAAVGSESDEAEVAVTGWEGGGWVWVSEVDSDTVGCDDRATDVAAVLVLAVGVVCVVDMACSVGVVEGGLSLNRTSLDRNVDFDSFT